MRIFILPTAILMIGCGKPPPNPMNLVPTAHASMSSSPTPMASASASNETGWSSPSLYRESPPEDEGELDRLAGTIDAATPAAPCDFSRNYRGTVGSSPWSVTLSRNGSALKGFVAYDVGTGELDLNGTVRPDGTITLEESKGSAKGGQITGKCAPETGIISGTWEKGKSSRPFELKPRSVNGVGIFERRHTIGTPVDDGPSCVWDVRSPAVFGMGNAERTGRINAQLKVQFRGYDEKDMERRTSACSPGAHSTVQGWYSIEANEQGLLSVLENGYVYVDPAVHGDFNAAPAAISIDVATGRKLALTDVVTSSKALRPVVTSCMKLVVEAIGSGDEWWFERDIQGVPTDKNGDSVEETSPELVASSLREPSFLVLPDGLAVLIRNQPTVSSLLELQGPVIQWGALLRAGILKSNSPVARLWANAKPLAANEPSCARYLKPKWAIPAKRN